MVQLRKNEPVRVETVTKAGECIVKIELDINVHLDQDGVHLGVSAKAAPEEEDKTRWVVPNFEDTPRVQFGKKV